MLRSFAYDLALTRFEHAGARWLDARLAGRDGHDDFDRLRRAFRREEKRDRRRTKKENSG